MRLMTKAGLNTIDSLHIAKDTFKNKYLKNEVNIVVSKVNAGTSISQALHYLKIFPTVFHQLLSSGDMGSQISEMFEKIKNFLDQEVESRRCITYALAANCNINNGRICNTYCFGNNVAFITNE